MPDKHPYRDFNFLVEIEGVSSAQFAEVTVPDAEITVVEYREGGDKTSVTRKLPGRVRYGNVVLKRGVSGDLALYDWFRAIATGDFQPRNVSIVLLDAERQPVIRWNVSQAWPTKYDVSDLKGKSNEVVIEMLELTHEGIQVEAVG
jgi:phage tail-like protein